MLPPVTERLTDRVRCASITSRLRGGQLATRLMERRNDWSASDGRDLSTSLTTSQASSCLPTSDLNRPILPRNKSSSFIFCDDRTVHREKRRGDVVVVVAKQRATTPNLGFSGERAKSRFQRQSRSIPKRTLDVLDSNSRVPISPSQSGSPRLLARTRIYRRPSDPLLRRRIPAGRAQSPALARDLDLSCAPYSDGGFGSRLRWRSRYKDFQNVDGFLISVV
ncbi:hypothetical protein BHM03_00001121 [Ensete ventricosum]|nr:hypothetical protein BHM03_00001121 [Ensete ventricosum]